MPLSSLHACDRTHGVARGNGLQANDSTATADSIIARYYVAIGGRAKLLARSRRMAGRYQEGAFTASTVILARRPSLRRVSVTQVSTASRTSRSSTERRNGSTAIDSPRQRSSTLAPQSARDGAGRSSMSRSSTGEKASRRRGVARHCAGAPWSGCTPCSPTDGRRTTTSTPTGASSTGAASSTSRTFLSSTLGVNGFPRNAVSSLDTPCRIVASSVYPDT